jgi:Zn-dependent peptidase ImmA (M78 family)/transcriptional regulator with XRE-family HTH domain
MCDIHTVSAVESWSEVGDRIRQARLASRLSQAELASELSIDRTALARVEGGQRQVSALELFRLSEVLHVPIAHFVARAPAAVVSHRRELTDDADQVARARFRMDAALEAHARDAEWLVSQRFLTPSAVSTTGLDRLGLMEQADAPRAVALELRSRLGHGLEPLGSMAAICGRIGLHVLVLEDMEAGASLLLDPGVGVAVIGGDSPPGRRRFTAAHELGHFVLQDEYTTDIGVAASRDEREQRIDTFAGEFLLPRDGLVSAWQRLSEHPARGRLVHVAGTYRVSWSTAVRAAGEAGLVDGDTIGQLQSRVPQRGEFLEVLGQEPTEDLMPGGTSSSWRRAVISAWRSGAITASRTVELLHGAITASELPDREEPDLL